MPSCRACGASILWTEHPETGERFPLDERATAHEGTDRYRLVDVRSGHATVALVGRDNAVEAYRDHRDVCPVLHVNPV